MSKYKYSAIYIFVSWSFELESLSLSNIAFSTDMDRATELYLTQVNNLLAQHPSIRSALEELTGRYGATHVATDADLSVEDHFAEDKRWSLVAGVLKEVPMGDSNRRYILCHRIAASVDPIIKTKYDSSNQQHMDEWNIIWKRVEAKYPSITALFDAVRDSSLSVDGTPIRPGIVLRRLCT